MRYGCRVDRSIVRYIGRTRYDPFAKPPWMGGGGTAGERSVPVHARLLLSALYKEGLLPVVGQFAVAARANRVATAADLLAMDSRDGSLVVVELKCGYAGERDAAAFDGNNMHPPLASLPDTVRNRHLAQLAATVELVRQDESIQSIHSQMTTMDGTPAPRAVRGILLHATVDRVEVSWLSDNWLARGRLILARCVA